MKSCSCFEKQCCASSEKLPRKLKLHHRTISGL